MCLGFAISIYRYGLIGFFSGNIEGIVLLAGFAGASAYFWIARRFLDRIADRRRWKPFARDLLGLMVFLVTVPAVAIPIFFVIVFVLTQFASGPTS
jgi:hypothetical protein